MTFEINDSYVGEHAYVLKYNNNWNINFYIIVENLKCNTPLEYSFNSLNSIQEKFSFHSVCPKIRDNGNI